MTHCTVSFGTIGTPQNKGFKGSRPLRAKTFLSNLKIIITDHVLKHEYQKKQTFDSGLAMLLPQHRVQKKQRVIEPRPFSCVHCSALTSRFEDMEQLIGHISRRHTLIIDGEINFDRDIAKPSARPEFKQSFEALQEWEKKRKKDLFKISNQK